MAFCQCGKEPESPDRNLFAELAKFHPRAMERTWTISGAYADWSMTITAVPPDDTEVVDAPPPMPAFPEGAFWHLGMLFRDAIDLYEATRDRDDRNGAGHFGTRVY